MPGARLFLAALAVVWLALLGLGHRWLLDYQAGPGTLGAAPADWPASDGLGPVAGRFTLLLFAHPHCPCTRASLQELSWVAARASDKADVCVLFVRPPGAPDGWERTGTWTAATAIPGVRVWADEDGREARRFGVQTSGQVLLYDSRGRLVFRGGITAGRGHQGDNPGRRALLARLASAEEGLGEAPVFGCPLFDDDSP
jgi:hypothetical protein